MLTETIAKQMIDFQKTTFDNSFKALVMLQDQTEWMVNALLEQTTWLPEEGKRTIDEWVAAYKKGRDDYECMVHENFDKIKDIFEPPVKKEFAKKVTPETKKDF